MALPPAVPAGSPPPAAPDAPLPPAIPARLAGLCGLAAPVFAFGGIGLAVAASPAWFAWTGSWLSDLGGPQGADTPALAGLAADALFNGGLVLAGLAGIVLAAGLLGDTRLGSAWGRRGAVLLALDCAALACVGLLPEQTGVYHVYASTAFFALVPLCLLPLGHALREAGEDRLGRLVQAAGAASVAGSPAILLPRPWGSHALAEMVPALCIGAASALAGAWMLGEGAEHGADGRGGGPGQRDVARPKSPGAGA